MPQTLVAPVTPLTLPFPLNALKGNAPSRFEAPGRLARFGFGSMFGGVINGTFLGVPNTNLQPGSETKANCLSALVIPKSVAGFTAVTYLVTIRFRGIFEAAQYSGGAPYPSAAGVPARTGGTNSGNDSTFYLSVSNPSLTLQLNAADGVVTFGGSLLYIDGTAVVPIIGGATVSIGVDTKDSLQTDVRFHSPELHSVNGVSFPFPGWYNGQWCQIDVVSAVPQ